MDARDDDDVGERRVRGGNLSASLQAQLRAGEAQAAAPPSGLPPTDAKGAALAAVRTGRLGAGALAVETVNNTMTDTTLVTVSCGDSRGLVHKVSKMLCEEHLSVVAASIVTRLNVAIDEFVVVDAGTGRAVPQERHPKLQRRLIRALEEHTGMTVHGGNSLAGIVLGISSMEADNNADPSSTVLVIRCVTRQGLMRDLSSAMLSCDVCVQACSLVCKDGDSAYRMFVTDNHGHKLIASRIEQLKERLMLDAMGSPKKRPQGLPLSPATPLSPGALSAGAGKKGGEQGASFADLLALAEEEEEPVQRRQRRSGSISRSGDIAVEATNRPGSGVTDVVVTCSDNRGLLHKISTVLLRLGCAVKSASVETDAIVARESFEVVDVATGGPVSENLHRALHKELLHTLENHTGETHHGGATHSKFDGATCEVTETSGATKVEFSCMDRESVMCDVSLELLRVGLTIVSARMMHPGGGRVAMTLEVQDDHGGPLTPLTASLVKARLESGLEPEHG